MEAGVTSGLQLHFIFSVLDFFPLALKDKSLITKRSLLSGGKEWRWKFGNFPAENNGPGIDYQNFVYKIFRKKKFFKIIIIIIFFYQTEHIEKQNCVKYSASVCLSELSPALLKYLQAYHLNRS